MRMSIYSVASLCLWLCMLCPAAFAEGELAPSDEAPGEVVIGETKDTLVNEFRINGQLYMIQVIPRKGPSYYLVDSDGDGNLETRRNDLAPDLLIPAWVLRRW